MSDKDPLVLIAFTVSLLALTLTLGQLLQQYFATAEGYRRCQASVMGNWGMKTHRRWRFREFRFETIYYVPSLSVQCLNSELLAPEQANTEIWKMDWKKADLEKTYVMMPDEQVPQHMQDRTNRQVAEGSGDMVCWVGFIDRIRLAQRNLNSAYPFSHVIRDPQLYLAQPCAIPTVPCIRIYRRSWDFMPPDIVRPLCLSTVSDIALLAILLGMQWKEFDPAKGKLRAEGSGHLITSRVVRSMGLCLEYISTESSKIPNLDLRLESYLPVGGVSDLIFGVVPINNLLKTHEKYMGTLEKLSVFLNFLDNTGNQNLLLADTLSKAMGEQPGFMPGYSDIIPITAPKMSSRLSSLCNLPMPNNNCGGVLKSSLGLQVFCKRLKRYLAEHEDASKQLRETVDWIERLECYDQWRAPEYDWACVALAERYSPERAYSATAKYRGLVHDALDNAETYLRKINIDPEGSYHGYQREKKKGFCYDTLVVEHIRMAITAYKTARKRLASNRTDQGNSKGNDWLSASMHVYWDELPELSERVADITTCDVQTAADAWVAMIFRAYCWHHCHRLLEASMILPSEWRGSKMPVYIG